MTRQSITQLTAQQNTLLGQVLSGSVMDPILPLAITFATVVLRESNDSNFIQSSIGFISPMCQVVCKNTVQKIRRGLLVVEGMCSSLHIRVAQMWELTLATRRSFDRSLVFRRNSQNLRPDDHRTQHCR